MRLILMNFDKYRRIMYCFTLIMCFCIMIYVIDRDVCDLADVSVIVRDFCVFAQSNVFDDITFDFLYKGEGCKSHTLTRLSFRPVGLWSVLFS